MAKHYSPAPPKPASAPPASSWQQPPVNLTSSDLYVAQRTVQEPQELISDWTDKNER